MGNINDRSDLSSEAPLPPAHGFRYHRRRGGAMDALGSTIPPSLLQRADQVIE